MTKPPPYPTPHGPFRADQLRSGDPYELSAGHTVPCLPTGGRGSRTNLLGAQVLETDPAVESAGVDTGFTPAPDVLRAPDVAVGNVADAPGWVPGAPPLALEYADGGQDEAELTSKVRDLLSWGTRCVWVVRLQGPRRVEVYERGLEMRLFGPGEVLEAPGVLRNPVPVEALYDRAAAHEAILRNLLQRWGYESLDAIHAAGRAAGLADARAEGKAFGTLQGQLQALRSAVRDVLETRGLACEGELLDALMGCQDPETLRVWLCRAAVVESSEQVLA
jgi:Uma2 family endonuclease